MTNSSSKKNKPYYKKQDKSKKINVEKDKSPMSNNTFLLGVGFLVIIYSRYLANLVSSVLVNIFGLSIMLYSMFRSMKEDKQLDKKRAFRIDLLIIAIILLVIIYNLYKLTSFI